MLMSYFNNCPYKKKEKKGLITKNLFSLETSYLLVFLASGLCFLQTMSTPFFPFSNKNLKNSFLPVTDPIMVAAFLGSPRLLEKLPENSLFQKDDILTKSEVSDQKLSFVESSSQGVGQKQTSRKSVLSNLSWEWGFELSFASGHISTIWNGIPPYARQLQEPDSYNDVRFSPCTSIRKKLPLDLSLAATLKSDVFVRPNPEFEQPFLGIFLESDFFFPVTVCSSTNFLVDRPLTGKPGIRLQTSKMNSGSISSCFQLFYEKDSWVTVTSDVQTLINYFLRERYPEGGVSPTYQVYSRKGKGVRLGVRFIERVPLT